MPSWNADQYLKFAEERTQPSRDLVARIAVESPRRAVDLGCGPGNSTEILSRRWPEADIAGVDNSPAMIEAARRSYPQTAWAVEDIAAWAARPGDSFDVVFSNAALQWLPDHAVLYPRIFGHVAPGGAFAVQAPANIGAPAHRIMRELAQSPGWRELLPAAGVREWHMHEAGFYYDLLAPLAARIDLWQTEYLHVMDGPDAIVDWYKGTGLRPFLDALPSDSDRERFLAEYRDRIRLAYPARPDGRVLFPFLRLFLVAYRGA